MFKYFDGFFNCSLQNFEVEYKAKKEARKRKGGPGGAPGGPDSETETSATPPPAKQRHPGEESRPRGFERGLFTILKEFQLFFYN